MAHAAHERRAVAAALLACVLLLGCSAGGVGGDRGGAPAPDRGRFNGLYQGRQFPTATNSVAACRGRTREVWFEVENGTVEMRNARHRRNRRKLNMLGTVSADGSVAIRQAAGGRSVAGRIEGDRLTAATVQDAQDAQVIQSGGIGSCTGRTAIELGGRSRCLPWYSTVFWVRPFGRMSRNSL